MMSDPRPRIWALLTHRQGDNNQVLALAQALGCPFETRTVRANWLRKLPKTLLADSLVSVRAGERRWLEPPWPDLVIGMGHRTVPVARYIRRRSNGRTSLVHLGNPRLAPRHFDLVITMPQYGRSDADNLLRLPIAMGCPRPSEDLSEQERSYFEPLPRPHRLMILGGRARLWRLDRDDMIATARSLIDRCEADGGTLLIVGSPRTSPKLLDAINSVVRSTRHRCVRGPVPRYSALLENADELYVTADSVSMVSDAILTGKPMGMIRIRPKLEGRLRYALADAGLSRPPPHDLRNFWRVLVRRRLVGTVDRPRAGVISDPVHFAAAAVRDLLGLPRSRNSPSVVGPAQAEPQAIGEMA